MSFYLSHILMIRTKWSKFVVDNTKVLYTIKYYMCYICI